jgi:CheY-like chemotaxis protein
MDLLMPVLDGFEVIRRLRQLPELKDVVAIALSYRIRLIAHNINPRAALIS